MRGSTGDPLLQPFTIKHLELRNRLVVTSHEPAYSEGGMPGDRYRRYHVERAKGGVGLTMIGGSAVVSPDSPPVFGNLLLYKDEIVPWIRRLCDDVHEHGAAVMCQVTHLGRRTSNTIEDWLPAVYPSAVREPAHRAFPKVAEEWDLERIVRDYADAAARCQAAGLDGIEIQSYGHFLDAFLSPATNDRHDQWGGNLENRMRFPLSVLRAVREAVGPDFIVGIRMMMDEDRVGGLTREDGIAALNAYTEQAGMDFVSVVKGNIESDAALARVIPGLGTPSAPFLDFCGRVKQDVSIPVMHASRIQDVATARHALRDNLVDLVGMTRPHIAEPHIIEKITAGNEERIRPCVGANLCLDSIYNSGSATCIHNPATGREGALAHTVTPTTGRRKKAVVVGAGPAGLEAARVLAGRGHDVVVLEANTVPGGQIHVAASSPRRKELIGIIDWRVKELEHAGVELRCGVFAEAEEVLAEAPDVVVVATGGLPNTGFLTAGADLVHDTWDILTNPSVPVGEVMVYDDHGGYPAMDAAEVLARNGARVHIVTPERTLAPDVGGMNSPAYLEVFARQGVTTTLGWWLKSVERSRDGELRAILYNEYAEMEQEQACDHIVVENGTLPNDELYFALLPESVNLGEVDHEALLGLQPQKVERNANGRFRLFRIGDAVASRNVHAAVLEAMRLCLPI